MPTLEITTMIGCPQRCTFCPQDALQSSYPRNARRMLTLEDFEAVLARIPPFVRIDFSGMSEPWANPQATDMLERTLHADRNVAIYTTLQGMRDPARVIELVHSHHPQVEVVVIHLPDDRGNMRGFRISDIYCEALDRFRKLAVKLDPKIKFMTMGDASPVGELTEPWSGNTRAGSLIHAAIGDQDVEIEPSHVVPVSCSYTPFYDQNVMLPNGDVLLCCMDYDMRHVIGNLLRQDYYEIFRERGIDDVRVSNMQYRCDGTICRRCSRARTHDVRDGAHQFWTWSE